MRAEKAIETIETMWNYYPLADAEKEALDMAIESLKKQIPKPVRRTTSTKRCSRCRRQLSSISNSHPSKKYCTRCGQAIDWGVEVD